MSLTTEQMNFLILLSLFVAFVLSLVAGGHYVVVNFEPSMVNLNNMSINDSLILNYIFYGGSGAIIKANSADYCYSNYTESPE